MCSVLVPREVVPEADKAAVYEDDLEEETLQADAEQVEKVMINDAYILLRVDEWQGTEFHPRH